MGFLWTFTRYKCLPLVCLLDRKMKPFIWCWRIYDEWHRLIVGLHERTQFPTVLLVVHTWTSTLSMDPALACSCSSALLCFKCPAQNRHIENFYFLRQRCESLPKDQATGAIKQVSTELLTTRNSNRAATPSSRNHKDFTIWYGTTTFPSLAHLPPTELPSERSSTPQCPSSFMDRVKFHWVQLRAMLHG